MYTNSYDAFLNVRNDFPVFSTALEANYVRKHEDAYAPFKLTDEDKEEIHRLARDARIGAPAPGATGCSSIVSCGRRVPLRPRGLPRQAPLLPLQGVRDSACHCGPPLTP